MALLKEQNDKIKAETDKQKKQDEESESLKTKQFETKMGEVTEKLVKLANSIETKKS